MIGTLAALADAVTASDIDSDGDLDVVFSSVGNHSLGWFQNTDGAGTFGPLQMISTLGLAPRTLSTGDVDGDGDVDVIVLNDYDDELVWHPNLDGNGNFGTAQLAVGFADPSQPVLNDVDGDGDLDLLISHPPSSSMVWYEHVNLGDPKLGDSDGDGLGDFDEVTVHGTSAVLADTDGDTLSDYDEINVHGTDPLDVDSDDDGLLDGDEIDVHGTNPLATDTDADGLEDAWEIAHGLDPVATDESAADPDSDTLSNYGEQTAGTDPHDSDTDGDGLLDGDEFLVHGTSPLDPDGDDDGLTDSFEVLGGLDPHDGDQDSNGRPDFQDDADGDGLGNGAEQMAGTNPTSSDSDGDGLSDGDELASGFFAAPRIISQQADGAQRGFMHDLDGDGDLDALSISAFDTKLAWYENLDGAGSFGPQHVIDSNLVDANTVVAGDIDGDGDGDIVVGTNERVSWYLNSDGAGSFDPPQDDGDAYGQAVNDLAVVDKEQDGDADILSAESALRWYEGSGSTPALSQQDPFSGTAPATRVIFADFDGDGDLDVLSVYDQIAFGDNDRISRTTNGDGLGGLLSSSTSIVAGTDPRDIAAADLDGDGDVDYAVVFAGSSSLSWYPNLNALGTFGASTLVASSIFNPTAVLALDIDSDGFQDLAYAARGSQEIAWHRNKDGAADFGQRRLISAAVSSVTDLVAADVDGDGDWDLVHTSEGFDQIAWHEQLNEYGTLPLDPDSDGDGLLDGDEVNVWGSDPANVDSDGDGLMDGDEVFVYGTNPAHQHTDGDGIPDGDEVANGTDPTDSLDPSLSEIPMLPGGALPLLALALGTAGAGVLRSRTRRR